MDKLSHIPKLSGKENYREWALELKGLAQWGNFESHFEDNSIGQELATPPTDDDKKDKDLMALLNEKFKNEQKAKGALMITTVVAHKDDLDPVSVASGLEDSRTAPTI